jgi:hypothetical protein
MKVFARQAQQPRAHRAKWGAKVNLAKRPVVEQQQRKRQRDHHRLRHEPQHKHERRGGAPPAASPLPQARVAAHRGDPEERAQDVLALSNPRHRLHPQRVQTKERGGKGARPETASHAEQHKEQQQHVREVEKHVAQVMAPRPHAVKLAVEHVAEPRQRVEIHRALSGERPGHARPAEPRLDARIVRDVERIIKIDEEMRDRLPVDQNAQHGQRHTDQHLLRAHASLPLGLPLPARRVRGRAMVRNTRRQMHGAWPEQQKKTARRRRPRCQGVPAPRA